MSCFPHPIPPPNFPSELNRSRGTFQQPETKSSSDAGACLRATAAAEGREVVKWRASYIGKAVIRCNRNPILGVSHDAAQTTVYRGYATTQPRTHHTTKLPPLHRGVREILQLQPGEAGFGGSAAIPTAPAAREETVARKHQHIHIGRAVSVSENAGDAVG